MVPHREQETTMTTKAVGVLMLVGMLGGCATMSGTTGSTDSAADPAVAAASQSLGIKDVLVQVAVTAARNYLNRAKSGVATVTQDAAAMAAQKEEAAKAGVQAAADKAKTEGNALTEPQQTGLVTVLKNLL
jgi:uncharacterized lipoprotein YajG